MKNLINIAVDGTAGSGKSSTMYKISKLLNFNFIDTGLMYRAFTKFCVKNNIDFTNIPSIIKLVDEFKFSIKGHKIFVNKVDYTNTLMDSDVTDNINIISVIPEVRKFMVHQQQKMVEKKGNIMIGRDITTVVLPNAELKFYFDSSIKDRANRRFEQNKINNITPNDYDQIFEEIKQRDYNDMTRTIGSLQLASNSILIDNSELNEEETIEKVLEIIKEYK